MLLYRHETSYLHQEPQGHPERVDRIRAIDALFAKPEYAALTHCTPSKPDSESLLRAHDADYLDHIQQNLPSAGHSYLDADTYLAPKSWEAALYAAGAAIDATKAVLTGEDSRAFCAMRPCGHHAERDRAMGFCQLGNAALAALYALEVQGLDRVAVVDFDVHHGNGTQDILAQESRALFISSHESPLYPGTGLERETGIGNLVNIELPAGDDGTEMRRAYTRRALPALEAHRPELIIFSAGFDAHMRDPLADLQWRGEEFAWITEQICGIAQKTAQGRIVSVLEGGYDLEGLTEGVAAHINVLMK